MIDILLQHDIKQKEQIKKANKEIVDSIKHAISHNKVDEYFSTWKHRPRYLEITDVLLCYPEGELTVFDLYDYIINNINQNNIPAFVKKIANYDIFKPLIIKDFTKIINMLLSNSKLLSFNTISYVETILNIQGGYELVIVRINDIIKSIDSGLINELLKKFIGFSDFDKIYRNNFHDWLGFSHGQSTIEMIKYLLKIDNSQGINYIVDNFEYVLKQVGSYNIFEVMLTFIGHSQIVTKMQKYIDLIIKYASPQDIGKIIDSMDSEFNLQILNNADVVKLLRDKLIEEKKSHETVGAIIKSKRNDYIKELILSMMKKEQVNDFVSIGDNTWSSLVFKIGSKVLKLSWVRNNPNCVQHYRIINPDLFEVVYDDENEPILYIEVQDYLSQENILENDIQDFYNDLENDNYIYIDPRGKDKCNFGILNSSKVTNMVVNNSVSETFKNKSLVLIDRDCVWKKDDPNIKWMGRY